VGGLTERWGGDASTNNLSPEKEGGIRVPMTGQKQKRGVLEQGWRLRSGENEGNIRKVVI